MSIDTTQTTYGADEVAELFGYSTGFVDQHADDLPVAPIRVGRTLRWPAAPVLRSLGIETGGES